MLKRPLRFESDFGPYSGDFYRRLYFLVATVQLHGWRITVATLKPLFVASRASRSGGHTGASAARPYRSLPVDGRLVLSIGRPVQAVVSPTYQDKPHNADDEKRG
jgi:hypothetical protein